MINSSLARLLAAVVILMTTHTVSLRAAPDDTLGMALLSATVQGSTPPLIARGAGVVSVTRWQTGSYDVVFDRDLSNCSCTVTPGFFTKTEFTTGLFATANCPFADNTVRVMTTDDTGALQDSSFHMIIFCPK